METRIIEMRTLLLKRARSTLLSVQGIKNGSRPRAVNIPGRLEDTVGILQRLGRRHGNRMFVDLVRHVYEPAVEVAVVQQVKLQHRLRLHKITWHRVLTVNLILPISKIHAVELKSPSMKIKIVKQSRNLSKHLQT